MIKVVANFFAGVIGFFIILVIIAIVIGVIIAMDTNANQQEVYIGVAMVIGGGFTFFGLGMSCVLLDIMFNIREISENTSWEEE